MMPASKPHRDAPAATAMAFNASSSNSFRSQLRPSLDRRLLR